MQQYSAHMLSEAPPATPANASTRDVSFPDAIGAAIGGAMTAWQEDVYDAVPGLGAVMCKAAAEVCRCFLSVCLTRVSVRALQCVYVG